ncbi:hypothetical protein CJF30_00011412 [Rutstroemia sp. NJR-2017a BBW]|nr:hypothetical protein CJF30_00011412 [Rutstroemia sp. NJR-2017a BBW]
MQFGTQQHLKKSHLVRTGEVPRVAIPSILDWDYGEKAIRKIDYDKYKSILTGLRINGILYAGVTKHGSNPESIGKRE